MSVARTVIRNIASNWVGLAVQIVTTLALTPFTISKIGLEAYGIWLLLQSTIGYYGLVDMGLRAGLTQALTGHIARKDSERVRAHLATAVPVLGALALVVIMCGLLVAFILPAHVEASEHLHNQMFTLILLQAVACAMQLPLAPYGAIIVGLQRYDIANMIATGTRLLSVLTIWFVLTQGGGLLSLAIILAITNLLDSGIRVIAVRRLATYTRGIRFRIDLAELKQIGRFGVWNMILNLCAQISFMSDTLVVGLMFSAQAVAPFGLAASLIEYGKKLLQAGVRVLFPTMANIRVQGDMNLQRDLYFTSTRLAFGLAATLVVVGSFSIKPFFELWLAGTSDLDIILRDGPLIFTFLGIAFLFYSVQSVGCQIMLASEYMKQLTVLYLIEAISNLGTSLVLARFMGVSGVALGTAIPSAIILLTGHLWFHSRILQVSYWTVLSRLLTRALLFTGTICGLCEILAYLVPYPTDWLTLVNYAVCNMLLITPTAFLLLLNMSQRDSIIAKIRTSLVAASCSIRR